MFSAKHIRNIFFPSKDTDISIYGQSTISLLLSLMLAEKRVRHTFYVPDLKYNALAFPPLSNPIVNSRVQGIEKDFLQEITIKKVFYLRNYTSISYDHNLNLNQKLSGDYPIPTYAIDNRLRLHDFFSKVRFSPYVLLKKLNKINSGSSVISVIGGAENYSSHFLDREELSVSQPQKSRCIFFINLRANDELIEKYNGVYIYYLYNIGEILFYPFLHADGGIAINLTVNIIKGGVWDVYDENIDTCAALRQIQQFFLRVNIEFSEDLLRCKPMEATARLMNTHIYYKDAVKYNVEKNNIMLGIGESVMKSDPLTGLGYNVGVDMASALTDILENGLSDRNIHAMVDEYGRTTSQLQEYVYHLNKSQTQGVENSYVHEIYALASKSKELRNFLFSAYDDLSLYYPWLINEEAAKRLIEKYQ